MSNIAHDHNHNHNHNHAHDQQCDHHRGCYNGDLILNTKSSETGITLGVLVAALPGARFLTRLSHTQAANVQITGINHDSRKVTKGDLFIAIRGERADGHEYLMKAAQLGAAALLVESLPSNVDLPDLPVVMVDDTRAAMARVAARFYGNPSMELALIGITGTNGKTSLTFLIEGIITAAGGMAGVIGTIEQRYMDYRFPKVPNTTPESLNLQYMLRHMVNAGISHVAMEVSSHALVTHRVDGCHFAARVFTNLTRDHLDFHHDMDSYFNAKCSLFTKHEGGPAVINVDDPRGEQLFLKLKAKNLNRLIGYSVKNNHPLATVFLDEAILNDDGIDAIIQTPSGTILVGSSLIGRVNLENIVAAAAVGISLGFSIEAIGDGLSSVNKIPGRLEKVPGSGGPHWPLIIVDYAHTPDALQKVLSSLKETCKGSLSVVFGCGGDRDKGKRPQMGAVAASIADNVIITSDNPRNEDPAQIIREVLSGIESTGQTTPPQTIPDRRMAIRTAIALAGPGDVILIAGKGHESTQTTHDCQEHFSDIEEAGQALAFQVVGRALSKISGGIMGSGRNVSS